MEYIKIISSQPRRWYT